MKERKLSTAVLPRLKPSLVRLEERAICDR